MLYQLMITSIVLLGSTLPPTATTDVERIRQLLHPQVQLMECMSVSYVHAYPSDQHRKELRFACDGEEFRIDCQSAGSEERPSHFSWTRTEGGRVYLETFDRGLTVRDRTKVVDQLQFYTPVSLWLHHQVDALDLPNAGNWLSKPGAYRLISSSRKSEFEIVLEFEDKDTQVRQRSFHDLRWGGWPVRIEARKQGQLFGSDMVYDDFASFIIRGQRVVLPMRVSIITFDQNGKSQAGSVVTFDKASIKFGEDAVGRIEPVEIPVTAKVRDLDAPVDCTTRPATQP